MDKKKIILLVIAILLAAALIVLVGYFSDRPRGEDENLDPEARYGSYIRQLNTGVEITLEKNGQNDYLWQTVTPEDASYTVTDESSRSKGKFIISGGEPGARESIIFRLTDPNSGKYIYEFKMDVFIDPNGVIDINPVSHERYTEGKTDGEGTAHSFVSYGGPDGRLIVDTLPCEDGEDTVWNIESAETVFVTEMIEATVPGGDTFYIEMTGEGEQTVILGDAKRQTAIWLVLVADEEGLITVKEQGVTEYIPAPYDASQFDAARAEFTERYGAFKLPAAAEESLYEMDSWLAGPSSDEAVECGRLEFRLGGIHWDYLVTETGTMKQMTANEREAEKVPTTETFGDTKVTVYSDEERISAFWAKDGRVYCLSGNEPDKEMLTVLLQEMLG